MQLIIYIFSSFLVHPTGLTYKRIMKRKMLWCNLAVQQYFNGKITKQYLLHTLHLFHTAHCVGISNLISYLGYKSCMLCFFPNEGDSLNYWLSHERNFKSVLTVIMTWLWLHVPTLFGVNVDLHIVDRRTGMPLNIKPRKDSQGFEIVDDYFPDSGLFHNPPFHNPVLAIVMYVG